MRWLVLISVLLSLFVGCKSAKEKNMEELRKSLPEFMPSKVVPGGNFKAATKQLDINYKKSDKHGVVALKFGSTQVDYDIVIIQDKDDDGVIDGLVYGFPLKASGRRECNDVTYEFRKKRGIKLDEGGPIKVVNSTEHLVGILEKPFVKGVLGNYKGFKKRVGGFTLYLLTFYAKSRSDLMEGFPLHVILSRTDKCYIFAEYRKE